VHGYIEGAPHVRPEHLAVFDGAFEVGPSKRCVSPNGHVRMMAAVQPFLSGAISKTVNLPNSATVEDVKNIFLLGWATGLKSLTVYRYGCKRSQPLNAVGKTEAEAKKAVNRRRLPEERNSINRKFRIGTHDGYLNLGFYGEPDESSLGELFIVMAKQGSTVQGLLEAFVTSVSIGLQYGVPLEKFIRKFTGTQFSPSGFTGNELVPYARSIPDFIFRFLDARLQINALNERPKVESTKKEVPTISYLSGEPCPNCGMPRPEGKCVPCQHCYYSGDCGG